MASQYERKYRVPPGGADLDEEFFNRRFKDVDLRLVKLEEEIGQLDEATDALIQKGLQQINTQLQASIASLQTDIAAAVEQVEDAASLVEDLEAAIDDIVNGGTLPASAVTVSVAGSAADDVEELLTEHQGAIEDLQNQINALGDVRVVADMTEAAALDDLGLWDVVHVADGGSGSWVRYQIMDPGDGTWADATKVTLWTEGQQPADHVHAIEDVTGLQAALDGKQAAAANLDAWAAIAPAAKQDADADTLKADVTDELEVGFTTASLDKGTKSSGTFQPNPAERNLQHFTNGGAFTLQAYAAHTTMIVDQVNNASAGVITLDFDFVDGDTPDEVDGNKFRHYITVGPNGSECITRAWPTNS